MEEVSKVLDDVTFTYRGLVLSYTEDDVVVRHLPNDYEGVIRDRKSQRFQVL